MISTIKNVSTIKKYISTIKKIISIIKQIISTIIFFYIYYKKNHTRNTKYYSLHHFQNKGIQLTMS